MRRSAVGLTEIADLHGLGAAFHAAARGRRDRPEVQAFAADLDRNLAQLREEVMAGAWTPGPMRRFNIRDPKPRVIHAPCFRDRVMHHAIMAQVGPVLDRALLADSFACRTGKGTIAAVQRAACHADRYPWFAQVDARAYFASIDHAVLRGLLARKLKNRAVLAVLARIIEAHGTGQGCGLPIGALTSQHFANFYLAGADRHLLEVCRVRGFVRYMDDLVWWTDSRAEARGALDSLRDYLGTSLKLMLKTPVRVGQSCHGLVFCGFRILPGRLLLSRRRKQRYAALRATAERAWARGEIDGTGLQAAYASALAVTAHADAAAWRREQLRRRPLEPTLAAI